MTYRKELIGTTVHIINTQTKKNYDGIIRHETKHTITIETQGDEKMQFKKDIIIIHGQETIFGKDLVMRREERIL